MPLTFAHPAAVLPFSRKSKYVNFLAMVLGSMAPDFEYFLHGRPYGEIGHTAYGFFAFNLPMVIIVYLVYVTFIHKTLHRHLPSFLQEAAPEKAPSTKPLQAIVFIYSALFGMLTHVVWDSFTHLGGFIVTRLSFLTYSFQLFGFSIPVFKLLQHGSTVAGLVAIFFYLVYRARRNPYEGERVSSRQKLVYWFLITLLTLLFFGIWQLVDRVSLAAYGVHVVRIIDSALISLLLVSLLLFKQRAEV
ncbi:DUF4184 family protein [Halalkalibacter oceani]|uniref:DUF4184 family protein n=1 Tax=Halalkalibacter oceani TaxID=1653776 RepID=A0A9X2IR65_9BACI|nr:DUF4184 family protein [Halalkalibacter oceani]MCM3716601.1 DUF4184 family protein [Halalkalibacter oceani]